MGCLIVQDFKNEAYILYNVLHISVLSAFFFLRLENDIWSIPRLKNEVSFKSFAFDMGCSAPWLKKNEAYLAVYHAYFVCLNKTP